MSQHRDKRAKQIQASIREVLLHEWDPIGIQDVPEAQDEYDSYVGGLYRLLASGSSEDELVEHLRLIETSNMGLSVRDESHQDKWNAKLRDVASRLRRLSVQL